MFYVKSIFLFFIENDSFLIFLEIIVKDYNVFWYIIFLCMINFC